METTDINAENLRLFKSVRFLRGEIAARMRLFPEITDLLRDAPILAVMLVYSRAQMRISLAEFVAALHGPRTEICRLLGGTGTKSELRLLLKVKWDAITEPDVGIAFGILSRREFSDTARLLKVALMDTFLADQLLRYPEAFASPAVRRSVEKRYSVFPEKKITSKEREEMKNLMTIARDAYRMAKDQNMTAAAARFKAITSAVALKRLHDDLSKTKDLSRYARDPLFKSTFDPPPLPGTDTIVPIKTYVGLFEEGQEMHNCVFSYCRIIWEKKYYVYKVLAPQRATLGILFEKNGKKKIDQLRLACNTAPSEETYAAVEKWFTGKS
jgi:hypothetical protein